MHLISLELQGFKSFPDKVKLEFGKGITGVVGPNGSGKSNIGDAIRWVLGEQSTKTLRGDRMEDVIFTGTQKRKPVGFAMVTLNIDNMDRDLDVGADIVSVSRKLYRNGDSEYILNGEQVRLKDVVELFMDTGLGRDGYSIIGQGKIADIVSSRSADRREIFEEAAGISKFRYKKVQAERKLAAAEDNILRLNDILGELEGRLEPLKEQSEKARRFRELDGEKQRLEISVWVHRLGALREVMNGLEDKLNDLRSQYDGVSRETEDLEKSVEDNLMLAAKELSDIEALREEIHSIELESAQSQSQIAVLQNDIEHLEQDAGRKREQISQSGRSAQELEVQRQEKLSLARDGLAGIQETDDRIKEFESRLNELSERDGRAEAEAEQRSSAVNSLYIRASELSFVLENSRNVAAETTQHSEQLLAAKRQAEISIEEISERLDELNSSLDSLRRSLAEHSNRQEGYSMLLKSKLSELEKVQKERTDSEHEAVEKHQRLKILSDLENSMEGLTGSVQRIIRASKQGRLSGVLGSVAQLVSVKQEYSLAVETALGAALQNVVVENEDTAKRCIRLLKEENGGRATFLPVTAVKGKLLSESGLEACDGFIALASELAECDKELDGVITWLLGRTAVAEDLNCASAIAKSYGYRFRVVTLDGQVINAGGSFTGGSTSKTTGILTRKHKIEQLKSECRQLDARVAELDRRLETLRQEADKLSAEADAEKDAALGIDGDRIRLEEEIKRERQQKSLADERINELDRQLKELAGKLVGSEKEFDEAGSELSEVKKKISDAERSLEAAKQAASEGREERERLSEALSQLRLHRVELVKDVQTLEDAAVGIAESISALGSDKSLLEDGVAEDVKQMESKHKQIEEIRREALGAGARIAQVNEQILEKQAEHTRLDTLSARKRAELKIKNDMRESLSQELVRASEKNTAVGDEYDKIVGSLWEQYELSKSEAFERAEKLSDAAEADRRLGELRNRIKRLGSVNLGAIEEYREVSERYGFLSDQLKDASHSKAELEKLIEQLTADMKTIFSESFEKINTEFKRIFTELFGGGRAELTLDDPENILECGIDINVAPPGKVIKNLSLLSGGEQAFVAISIYFAILAVKPSPFCLLDEIEAALDDVNVTRFAQYLRRFAGTTQFIAITHRRGTMEEADVLYGVTMQEKGVSRLLRMTVDAAAQTVE